MINRANAHHGTAFVEVYQNCPVFNDGVFFIFTEKESKKEECLFVEHGKPMVFGQTENKGVKLNGFRPEIVELGNGVSKDDLWIHDENDKTKAFILAQFADFSTHDLHFPRPFGVFYREDRACIDEQIADQITTVQSKKPKIPLNKILSGEKTWTIL